MVMRFYDPFVLYGDAADVASKGGWTVNGSASYLPTGGQFGLGALTCVAVNDHWQRAIAGVSGKVIAQFRFKPLSITATTTFLSLLNEDGTSTCLHLAYGSTGRLRVNDRNGTLVQQTAGSVFTAGRWHYVAIEAEVGSEGGTVKVWVDQASAAATPLLDLTEVVMTAPETPDACDAIRLLTSGGADHYFGDLVVFDNSGAAPNAYLGEKMWYARSPNGAGASAEWSPNTGTNHGAVDDALDASSDEDTTYVESVADSNEQDYYACDDIPTTVTGISFVAALVEARHEGEDSEDFKVALRETGGTTSTSADQDSGAAYAHFRHGTVDVPGGSGWTASQVNSSQVGVDTAP